MDIEEDSLLRERRIDVFNVEFAIFSSCTAWKDFHSICFSLYGKRYSLVAYAQERWDGRIVSQNCAVPRDGHAHVPESE